MRISAIVESWIANIASRPPAARFLRGKRPPVATRLLGRHPVCQLLVSLAWSGWLAAAASAAAPAGSIDLQPRPLATIAPGSIIDRHAPQGWSDLIVEAYPRLGQGDTRSVPQLVADMASLITFSMAANVVSSEAPNRGKLYKLDRVGWGLGTVVKGKNTIISSSTVAKQGIDLGYIGYQVLRRNEDALREGFVQTARTDTMSICDGESRILYRGEHRQVILRHIVLVSPTTGQVTTLVWPLDFGAANDYILLEPQLQWLPRAMREDRVINVDGNQFFLGIPTNDAFALVRVPQGTPVVIPPVLRQLVTLRRFSVPTVLQFESAMRELCQEQQAPAATASAVPATPTR